MTLHCGRPCLGKVVGRGVGRVLSWSGRLRPRGHAPPASKRRSVLRREKYDDIIVWTTDDVVTRARRVLGAVAPALCVVRLGVPCRLPRHVSTTVSEHASTLTRTVTYC